MLKRRILYSLIILFLAVLNMKAQQAPLYSQYVLNSFLINPAIAGAEGYSSLNITAREQWIGIKDSPSTYALSFNTMIKPNSFIKRRSSIRLRQKYGYTSGKVGLGGYVFRDQVGALGRTGLRFSYAYHMSNKSSGTQLSFGFSLAAYQLKFDEDRVILRDPDDEFWITAREPLFIPDADIGFYFSAPDYFFGFSVDQLMESIIKFGSGSYNQFSLDRNYYLFGGYDFNINKKLILSPSALIKYAENGAFQGDLGAKLVFKQTYWGGLTYRTGDALIVLAGISIDRYVFGYAFDFSLSSIMKRSFGSHEFMFALKLGDYNKGYRYLRR